MAIALLCIPVAVNTFFAIKNYKEERFISAMISCFVIGFGCAAIFVVALKN
jgi:hypothetical protein